MYAIFTDGVASVAVAAAARFFSFGRFVPFFLVLFQFFIHSLTNKHSNTSRIHAHTHSHSAYSFVHREYIYSYMYECISDFYFTACAATAASASAMCPAYLQLKSKLGVCCGSSAAAASRRKMYPVFDISFALNPICLYYGRILLLRYYFFFVFLAFFLFSALVTRMCVCVRA